MSSYSVLFSNTHRTNKDSQSGNGLWALLVESVVGDGRQSGLLGFKQLREVEDRPGWERAGNRVSEMEAGRSRLVRNREGQTQIDRPRESLGKRCIEQRISLI